MLYKLNRRIKVRRWNAIKNEFGGLVPIEVASWYKWAEVRASNWINLDLYNTRSGRSLDQYDQQQWEYDTTIIMRYEIDRPTRSNDTLEYEGTLYKINSITINNEYAKNFEIIKCSKIDENINNDAPMDLNSIQYYNYIGIGGENVFNLGLIIGKHVFNCFKDGVQFKQIDIGVPNGKEVFVNTSNGDITWGLPFADGEIATILYY